MIGLTPKQARVLAYLEAENGAGRFPHLEEIAAANGSANKSTAHFTIKALIERGHVMRHFLPEDARLGHRGGRHRSRFAVIRIVSPVAATEPYPFRSHRTVADLDAEQGRVA